MGLQDGFEREVDSDFCRSAQDEHSMCIGHGVSAPYYPYVKLFIMQFLE